MTSLIPTRPETICRLISEEASLAYLKSAGEVDYRKLFAGDILADILSRRNGGWPSNIRQLFLSSAVLWKQNDEWTPPELTTNDA